MTMHAVAEAQQAGKTCSCGQPVVANGECAACNAKRAVVQRQPAGTARTGSVSPLVSDVLGSPGRPLDPATRGAMETGFGADFSGVRVHTDARAAASARAIDAQAYTVGPNIAFDASRYDPGSGPGRRLLAHELAHVVQQRGAPIAPQRFSLSQAGDAGERAADSAAEAVVSGGLAPSQPKTAAASIDRKGHEDKAAASTPSKAASAPSSYIIVTPLGASGDYDGIADKDGPPQLLSKLLAEYGTCWKGDQVVFELRFGTSPFPTDGSCPVQTPPTISVALTYKDRGDFTTTYRYAASDTQPVWRSEGTYTANWHPKMQQRFSYPLKKRGELQLYIKLTEAGGGRQYVYEDAIVATRCGVVDRCDDGAIHTNRWVVVPKSSPIHPLSHSQPDDGEHYEMLKRSGEPDHFICHDDGRRISLDAQGYERDSGGAKP